MKAQRNRRRRVKEKATRLPLSDIAKIVALPLITFSLTAWLIACSAKEPQEAGIDRVRPRY